MNSLLNIAKPAVANTLLNVAKPAIVNSFKLQANRIIGTTKINATNNLTIRSYHENVNYQMNKVKNIYKSI